MSLHLTYQERVVEQTRLQSYLRFADKMEPFVAVRDPWLLSRFRRNKKHLKSRLDNLDRLMKHNVYENFKPSEKRKRVQQEFKQLSFQLYDKFILDGYTEDEAFARANNPFLIVMDFFEERICFYRIN